ncbi:hypothetical protein ACFO3D_04875 [Virgibacillus kekensis]|uniref:Uncharacterized protein n=1 Tax=Virgibacillus kekensis TaxID=202261 RepID=A0ABV9DIH5_9BACI
MVEQERYKDMLKKMIEETEKDKFQSSEEVIKALVTELTRGNKPIAN